MPSPFGRRREDRDPYRLVTPGAPSPDIAPPVAAHAERIFPILLFSVIGACLVIFLFGAGLWALDYRLVRGPTPTPTATPTGGPTATPDDRLTPNAPAVVTLEPGLPATPGTDGGAAVALPVVTGSDGAPISPLPGGLALPILSSEQEQTPGPPDSAPLSPLATPAAGPVALPLLAAELIPTATPQPPTATPVAVSPVIPPTLVMLTGEAPAATPTLALPPPTSTLTPTPLPPIFTVGSLKAFVGSGGATVYVGPSTVYTPTGTLSEGQEVRLIGRTLTGEWVYICCQDNENVWVRQANAQPSGNELQPGAPEDSDPNNVRWLNVQPTPTMFRVLWTPPPLAEGDYLLHRYDRGNRAQFAHLPNPPATRASWANTAQAGQALISPVIVSGQSVIVASADNHLYSFDRSNGSQRWRYDLGRPVFMSPAVQNGIIYVVDDIGQMSAFEDRGNEAVRKWITPLGVPPASSFNVFSDTLFISTGQDVKAVDLDDGAIIRSLNAQGGVPHIPTIGGQLLFAGGNTLVAYDIYSAMDRNNVAPLIIWRRNDIAVNPTAPLLYSWPGVEAVAELYMANGNNRIFAFDANTGKEIWNQDNDARATGLAVNNATLFVSGSGYVKAFARHNGDLLWQTDVGGNVLGGPYADNTKAIIYLDNGTVHFLDSASGAVTSTVSPLSSATATSAAAISGQFIFAPGADGRLQALSGLP